VTARRAAWRRYEDRLDSAATAESGGVVRLEAGMRVPRAALVTPNLFATLGVTPLLGRTFTEEEAAPPKGAPVAVLSHGLWQRRYGGDPGILGRKVLVDGVPMEILGVASAGFRLPTDYGEGAAEPAELWLPLPVNAAETERGSHGWYAAAELRPGATVAQANAELRVLAESWEKDGLVPVEGRFWPFAVSVKEEITGSVRPALFLLAGATGLLLLVACANVAGLLLARAESRQREMALRASLGAGGVRLVTQLLAESTVLALPGLVAGLALASALVRLLATSGLLVVPRAAEVHVDLRMLGFAMATAVATTVLFSLAPAVRLFDPHLAGAVRESGSTTPSPGSGRLRAGLVVGEIAVSVVLLLGAGLLLRSLHALTRLDLGFRPEGVLTVRVSLPEFGYEKPQQVTEIYARLVERVRQIPGVTQAGVIRSLPLGAQIGDWGLEIEGYVPPPGTHGKGDWQVASDGALEALGERLLKGRAFTPDDRAEGDQVALVNETFARKYWPGQEALGKRIRMGEGPDRAWVTVVGVMGDVRHNGLRAPIKEKFYRPHAQFHRSTDFAVRNMTLVVRGSQDPRALFAPIRDVVRDLDPALPLAAVRPMTDVVGEALATARLAGTLVGLFAGLALLLAAVGLFGVLAWLVSRRTREIGVRLALGADPAGVRRLVRGQGLRLACVGVAVGLALAAASGRMVEGLLVGVRAQDPASAAAAVLLLFAAAFLAADLPARRAARVDPARALRAD
jgi:putative ABC transport system permease protein